jgi:YHS domain-containing protein
MREVFTMDLNIIWILLAACFMFLMMRGGGCCGGHGGHGGHGGYSGNGGHSHGGYSHGNHQNDMETIDFATDPVCGMKVSKKDAVIRTIDGKTYYFCSKDCADSFKG